MLLEPIWSIHRIFLEVSGDRVKLYGLNIYNKNNACKQVPYIPEEEEARLIYGEEKKNLTYVLMLNYFWSYSVDPLSITALKLSAQLLIGYVW